MRLKTNSKLDFSDLLAYVLVLSFFVFLVLFSSDFIAQERTIYFWDYATFSDKFFYLGDILKQSATVAIGFIRNSFKGDYNTLPVLLTFYFQYVFGKSRVVYIVANLLIYVLPSILILKFLLEKLIEHSSIKKDKVLISIAMVASILFDAYYLVPVLMGYPDVGGVILILVIFLLYSPSKEIMPLYKYLLLGLILSILFLFRRWYGYWIFAFILTYTSFSIELLLKKVKNTKKMIQKLFLLFFKISSTVLVLILVLLLFSLDWRHILSVYSTNTYSAYRESPWTVFWHVLHGYLGNITILLSLFGIFVGLLNRKIRVFILFITLLTIFALLAFMSKQNLNEHHYYLVHPLLLIFISLGIYRLLTFCKNEFVLKIATIIIVILGLINFLSVTFPGIDKKSDILSRVFATHSYYPQRRNDFPELFRMAEVLQNLYKRKAGNIYLLSSTFDFNDNILRNYCNQSGLKYDWCISVSTTAIIDKRDGFPIDLIRARYILVNSNVVNSAFAPDSSRVLSEPAEDLLNGGEFGQLFKKLPYTFQLQNNTKIYLFEKAKLIPDPLILKMEQKYENYYPNYKKIFDVPLEFIDQEYYFN